VRNPQVKLNDIHINHVITDKAIPGWKVLFVTLELDYKKKHMKVPEMLFVNDNGLVTTQLGDLKTGKQFRDEIRPPVPDSIYDDAHLLYGNKDAEHKVVVFSDPMCPFCRQEVPALMKAAKEHPDKIALYYYHLPLLNIHPVSGVLTKIMHEAQKEGKTDVIEKIYSLKIPFKETDVDKIIDAVKKQTGYEASKEKILSEETKKALRKDEDAANNLMVRGTPAIFIDGEWDRTRVKYKQLVK
jgi:protein-disulfide isomerase